MKSNGIGFIAALVLGALIKVLYVFLVGFTAAIAMPAGYAQFVQESSMGTAAHHAWNLAVVQFPAIGLSALLATWVICRWLPGNRWLKVLGLVLGALVANLGWALAQTGEIAVPSPVFHQAEWMLLGCALLVGLFVRSPGRGRS